MPRGRRDRLRAYSVLVDSQESGSIRPGETLQLEVAAGPHSVQIAIDWARSPTLEIVVAGGETVLLRCAPNTAQSPLLGATLGRGKYVSLWHVEGPDADQDEDVMPFPWVRVALLVVLLAAAGLSFADHRPVAGVALLLFAIVPAVVVVAWVYVRSRRML
jgi:hypothetical protein